MTDDPRVQQLLDELLAAHTTPEAVCESCPELLPVVRKRWRRIRRLNADLDALFPFDEAAPQPVGTDLPQVPGYEVEAVLGRGGMGVVYKARQRALDRLVALKMLLAGPFAASQELDRFRQESAALACLRHPNIVQVYDAGEAEGRPYFTMEFVEGGSLAQKLTGTPQPARASAALLATLAEAVQVAHSSGIVHRDLKPSNVLLTADGTPKIADFGLARRFEGEPALTLSGTPVGTPSYMAPEQAAGQVGAVGPAVDVYALGTTLYELLTGRPPFRGETGAATLQQVISQQPVPPSRLNAKVPRDLEIICLKCLRKEPGGRYPSAAALAEDVERFLRGEAITARPEGRLERLARWARRRPALAVGLAGSLLLAAALVGGGLWVGAERSASRRARAQLARLDAERRGRELVTRLEDVHLNRVALLSEPSDWRASRARADRDYATAFREASFGEVDEDSEVVAARLKASAVRGPAVAALDDWAVCVADPRRRAWLLAVARRADGPGPTGWRARARDPSAWHDPVALAELARTASVQQETVRLLAALGERMLETRMDAVTLLEKVQQEHPDDFWANLALANVLVLRGQHADRARYYQAALALRPGSAVIYNNLGTALAGAGRMNEAIDPFRQAIRLNPEFALAHGNLGSALKRLRRYGEAIDQCRQAVRLEPGNARHHNNLGLALAETGRNGEAIDCWRQALRLDFRCGSAHSNLGVALASKGRLDEAIGQFKLALHDPLYAAAAHNNLGYALQMKGQRNDAIGHFRQAIRLQPGYALAHFHLAHCLRDTGRLDESIGHYERAMALDPGEARANKELRGVLLRLGRGDEVCFAWRKELQAGPPVLAAWDGYAELCLFLGRKDEYRRARTELLKRFGGTADHRVAERVGRSCLLLPASEDELRQATNLIDRALASEKAKPGSLLPYFRFAKALAEYRAGHLESALTLLDGKTQRVLGPAPRLLLAIVQHRLGKADAARETFRAAAASYVWDEKKATDREAWMCQLLRSEAETVLLR